MPVYAAMEKFDAPLPLAVTPMVTLLVLLFDAVTVYLPLLQASLNVTAAAPLSYTSPRPRLLTSTEETPVLATSRTSALLLALTLELVTTSQPLMLLTVFVVTPSWKAETVKLSCCPAPVMPTVVVTGVAPDAVALYVAPLQAPDISAAEPRSKSEFSTLVHVLEL